MRRLIILSLVLCLTTIGLAQVPESFNFQTVYHETHGTALPDEDIKLIANILHGDENGDIVYREEHSVTSNEFGLINIKIGTGTVLYGSWEEVEWSEADQYLMIELDPTATGNNYVDMGIAQLISVPYALFASQSTDNDIWEFNDQGLFYEDGKVGIGFQHPVADLELGSDKVLLVSSSLSDMEDNDIIQIKMNADTARPNIHWEDIQTEEFGASLSVREFTTSPTEARFNFIMSTADENFSRRARMKLKFDENIADMAFIDCNIILEGNFTSGSTSSSIVNSFWANQWIYNDHYFGIGDKNWEADGVYPGAAAEVYSSNEDVHILLHAESVADRAQLNFRRGNAEWLIRNEDIFTIRRNTSKKIKIHNNGDIQIGSSDAEHKLDVSGDINIPSGYSYLVGGGKSAGKYAEYFETEENMNLGNLAGINVETGLVRNYSEGDIFIGIVCEPSGFIANNDISKKANTALIALEGMMEIQSKSVKEINHQIFTSDGQLIGVMIGDQVLIH